MFAEAPSKRPAAASDIAAAVGRLRSLHDGEAALPDVVALGQAAREPLAALLGEREPSGIFQPRCLAARALGLLRADDLLIGFLRHPRFAESPIERAGEDAAINAAARALTRHRSNAAFAVLLGIAGRRPHFDGVVEALAGYGRAEAVPALVCALAEDVSRAPAQAGLRRIGAPARQALLAAAGEAIPDTETHRRQRHAALSVLLDIGPPDDAGSALGTLIDDECPLIVAVACGVALRFGPSRLRRQASGKLAALERDAPLPLAIEIAAIRQRLGGAAA
jgi:hypothetical protein